MNAVIANTNIPVWVALVATVILPAGLGRAAPSRRPVHLVARALASQAARGRRVRRAHRMKPDILERLAASGSARATLALVTRLSDGRQLRFRNRRVP